GARDTTKLMDGIGPCGRQLCCSSYLKKFDPISVKMAKGQDMPLTDSRLLGNCGRLKCCLLYEFSTYEQLRKHLPKVGTACQADCGGQGCMTGTLRKGVRFHNGKEMTSADVVPSLQHWAKLSTTGKAVWKSVEAIEAKDPYTVVIYLKEPSGSLLYALGSPNNGGAIYPKEVVAAAGDAPVKEYIGTGPYRFVEHKPDRHVKIARFKEYSARSEAPNGYGGKRTAYIDEIY